MPFIFSGSILPLAVMQCIECIEIEYRGFINSHNHFIYATQLLKDLRVLIGGDPQVRLESSCEPALRNLIHLIDPRVRVDVICQFHNYLMMLERPPLHNESRSTNFGLPGVDFSFRPPGSRADARRRLARIFAADMIQRQQLHSSLSSAPSSSSSIPCMLPQGVSCAIPPGFDTSGDICCICHGERESSHDPIVITLCCRHWLHRVCFDTFRESYAERQVPLSCPLCRMSLNR
jgi:hypothetical protein